MMRNIRHSLKTVADLKVDGYSGAELSTSPTLKEYSPALGELDDNWFDHRVDFDQTSEGYDGDSEAANFPATRPRITLDRLPVSPRPSNYLQDPGPPLPPGLHRRQVSESAIETIQRPEPPAPAIVPVSDSMSLVLVDFKERVKDWKGHNPEQLGDLMLHEVLLIINSNNVTRIYHAYLFEHIMFLCKVFSPRTKKGSFWRSKKPDKSSLQASELQLKGRIHMRDVTDVCYTFPGDGQYRMHLSWKGDSNEEEFSICFNDQNLMMTWGVTVNLQSKASKRLYSV